MDHKEYAPRINQNSNNKKYDSKYEKYKYELLKQRKEAKEELLDNHDNYKECD